MNSVLIPLKKKASVTAKVKEANLILACKLASCAYYSSPWLLVAGPEVDRVEDDDVDEECDGVNGDDVAPQEYRFVDPLVVSNFVVPLPKTCSDFVRTKARSCAKGESYSNDQIFKHSFDGV
ncbi:MAG: hypothetical protein ACI8TQ_001046 [Planctomycetota bacterium]